MPPRSKKPRGAASRSARAVSDAGSGSGARAKLSPGGVRTPEGEVEMSSTDAQNNFGSLLDQVARNRPVFIRRRNRRQAVMISVERYEALTRGEGSPALDALTAEFDAMLERMQTPAAQAAGADLFTAAPEEFGEAAVAAARPTRP